MGKKSGHYDEFHDEELDYVQWDVEPYATLAERVGKGRRQRRQIRKAWSKAKRDLEKQRWQRAESRWRVEDDETFSGPRGHASSH